MFAELFTYKALAQFWQEWIHNLYDLPHLGLHIIKRFHNKVDGLEVIIRILLYGRGLGIKRKFLRPIPQSMKQLSI